jgi:ATP/ADP translocase/HEAT repeat protein
MGRQRRDRILETLLQVRPGEFGLTALLFVQCLSVVGAFIVGRSVRDALFLAHGSREQLPLMYIASAVSVAVVGMIYSRFADRFRRDHLTAGCAALFGLGFPVAWLALPYAGDWIFSALYIFVEVVGALTVIQFWTLANDIFHTRDAKRLFGTIGAGGTLANILFGGAVGALAKRVGAESLLLLCMLLLGAVALFSLRLGKRVPVRLTRGRTTSTVRAGARNTILASPHLGLVAMLAAITFLTTTLIDFQFKTIAASAFEKDALAAFFGNFYALTGVLALLVQFIGTARLLSRFGVILVLGILPFFLGAGSVAMLAFPVLASATFTKGSEFVFRYTINDATTQLLYLPVSASVRAGAKAFIDGVIKPGAIALSGLLLIAYQALPSPGFRPLAVASAVCCAAWGFMVLRLQDQYVRSLQETLRQRRLGLQSARQPIADGATTRAIHKALESTDPDAVLNALELLPFATVGNIDSEVVRLLENPAAPVRISALRHLSRRGSLQHGSVVLRHLEDPHPEVRAAAVDAFCAIERDKAIRKVKPFLKDPLPQIRAAAITSMIRFGGLDGVISAAEALKALIADPQPLIREQAARVLGAIGVRNFYHPLLELMNDRELSVRRAAIAAAGQLKAPELVTPLLWKLARAKTTSDAIEALSAYGPGYEHVFEKILDNVLEMPDIRRAVPRILGRLGTENAVRILVSHLSDPDESVRSAIYLALNRSLRKQRGFSIDRKPLLRALHAELARAYHALACAEALQLGEETGKEHKGREAAQALLASALREKTAKCETRTFILLAILFPEAEIELIYAGIQDSNPQEVTRRRANSVELLENVLDRPLRRVLFPLVEDAPRDVKLRAAAESFPVERREPESRLCELCADENVWVRACAIELAGERPDWSLESGVVQNLDHASPMVREAAIAALEKRMPLAALARAVEKRAGDESEPVRLRVEAILAREQARLKSGVA